MKCIWDEYKNPEIFVCSHCCYFFGIFFLLFNVSIPDVSYRFFIKEEYYKILHATHTQADEIWVNIF